MEGGGGSRGRGFHGLVASLQAQAGREGGANASNAQCNGGSDATQCSERCSAAVVGGGTPHRHTLVVTSVVPCVARKGEGVGVLHQQRHCPIHTVPNGYVTPDKLAVPHLAARLAGCAKALTTMVTCVDVCTAYACARMHAEQLQGVALAGRAADETDGLRMRTA